MKNSILFSRDSRTRIVGQRMKKNNVRDRHHQLTLILGINVSTHGHRAAIIDLGMHGISVAPVSWNNR